MLTNYWIGPFNLVTPLDYIEKKWIEVKNGNIEAINPEPSSSAPQLRVHGENYFLYPALINAHDHLIGNLDPKVGEEERPYPTVFEWLEQYPTSIAVHERKKIDTLDFYTLGSYKNLLSGVITVQDHFPRYKREEWPQGGEGNEPFIDKMPIRVTKNYTLDHEIHSREHPWGDGPIIEHKKAVENDWPYITHIEEGFDEECMKGIDKLIEAEALTENTVLIHAVACSDDDIYQIGKRGSHVVTCPYSNFLLLGKTARLKEMMQSSINISLGTDSTASGTDNILDEMRFLKQIYYDMYKEELPDYVVAQMVTINPAKALRIDDYTGSIEVGKKADLLLVKGRDDDPYKSLVETRLEDISLLIYEGRPIYGDAQFKPFMEHSNIDFSSIFIDETKKLVIGNPLDILRRIRKALGYKKVFPYIPIS